jgi:septum formation protein
MDSMPQLHLASSSPRRAEILRALGLDISIQGVAIDESPLDGELPLQMVLRLAQGKAAAASVDAGRLVLGADTVVVLEQKVLGKPRDEADAIDMLLSLSGRRHQVLTGVALKTSEKIHLVHSMTNVQFREIGRDEATLYWQSGEPADKAGAYGIQGLGGQFVMSIDGSYSGVVGLPVFETAALLRQAGIDLMRTTND